MSKLQRKLYKWILRRGGGKYRFDGVYWYAARGDEDFQYGLYDDEYGFLNRYGVR